MSEFRIELPDELQAGLRTQAEKAHTSAEDLVARAVRTLLDNYRWLEQLDERATLGHSSDDSPAEATDLELPEIGARIAVPPSLRTRLDERARKDDTTVEEFVLRVVNEAVDQLSRFEDIRERLGGNGNGREKFHRVLAKVPDVEPPEYDRL